MNSIKTNLIYNIIYQILLIILPFITVPYVSRVLGAEGIGIYSYTYSIINYFMLFGLLGINNYGNRTIAKSKNDKTLLSINFISIYVIQIISNILMIIIYLGFILLFPSKYKLISFIQTIYLISNMLDINWFFFGLEKFKVTVSRNILLKFTSLILIFLLVKDPQDVWIYTSILAISTLLSQLFLIPFLLKEIDFIKIKWKDIKKHLKPCLVLFIPVIAVSLYRIMDKLMLGIMSNIAEVGYYEQAEKVISIPLGIITALGTVMLPRISSLVSSNQKSQIKIYIKKSMEFMMFLAYPLFLGLVKISNKFILLFMGDQFIKTAQIIKYLSITIIFISFANILKTQFLIPYEKDKDYIISTIFGALINLILNILLIPKYSSIGACIGTIFAELFVMLYQIYAVKKDLPIKEYIKINLPFLLKSIVMYIVISFLDLLNLKDIITIILQIVLGMTVYFSLNYKYIKKIVRSR